MSEHKPLPVAGYTPQLESAIDAVNHNKRLEEQVLRVIDQIQANKTGDARCAAIARTQIEQGFMALNRAIFQPQRIDLT